MRVKLLTISVLIWTQRQLLRSDQQRVAMQKVPRKLQRLSNQSLAMVTKSEELLRNDSSFKLTMLEKQKVRMKKMRQWQLQRSLQARLSRKKRLPQ